ncbi:MAG: DUF2493 domain-containing protein [Nitrospirae bacterium]|nr:DUF2493 domain-containing protein [Nitrospirota bacterium]
MRKIAVVGSRDFKDYPLLKKVLDEYEPFILISGGALKGADVLAEQYADERKYQKLIFKPDKKKYGRGAYHRRNQEIISMAQELVAFWNGESRGTSHTISLAEKKGIPVRIIRYTVEQESC